MVQDLVQPLAKITPAKRNVASSANIKNSAQKKEPSSKKLLSSQQKAAIIVRFLLAQGASIPISSLPEQMQEALTEQMGVMRLVDHETMLDVLQEFISELDSIGLTFPNGINSAIELMSEHLSTDAANRLRRLASSLNNNDPWERIIELPAERLKSFIEIESNEVAAVVLSKIPVSKAADVLSQLPGERARWIAYAIAFTEGVSPQIVQRIGISLASQLDAQPVRAFNHDPIARVGEILNVSAGATRDDVLEGFELEDALFAQKVRKAIFIFSNIPARITPMDAPKILRAVENPVLVTALAGAKGDSANEAAAEFLLSNVPQRLAQSLREEIDEAGNIKPKDAENAMSQVIRAIKQLESTNEITFIQIEEEEEQ